MSLGLKTGKHSWEEWEEYTNFIHNQMGKNCSKKRNSPDQKNRWWEGEGHNENTAMCVAP